MLPAFAEVAPVYYDDVIEYTDDMINKSDVENDEVVEEQQENTAKKPVVVQRNVAGRSVSRVTSAGNNSNTNSRANTSSRVVASSPRNAQPTNRSTVSRTTKKQVTPTRTSVVARSRAGVASRNTSNTTVSARNTTTNKPTTARVSATGNVISSTRVNNNNISGKVLTDSGDPLYISGSARVGVVGRRSTVNGLNASTPVITNEDITNTTSTLTNLAELTEYCKNQYATCMDNYCNVLDNNQGRCSCSANVKAYEKTEQSLAAITEDFQDVVQKIKYIGLTKSQIEALFSETEAELAMKSNSDTSQLKTSLDAIKKKIVDVSSGKTSSNLTDGITFDLSGLLTTDFSSNTFFDLTTFLGGNNSKVNSQRGTALFNTATQRCKTAVLNSCVSQGIDSKVITNSYDLAIDKQCIEYENSLNEANAEMRNNVRNAQTILQQARLLLAQQKNAYDLRGCVAALDECMQDEYVCGDEYELCLDPTGKYLANGEIVKGGTPGIAGGSPKNQSSLTAAYIPNWKSCGMYGLYATWDYGDDVPTNPASCQCTDDDCSNVKGSNAWGTGTGENLNAYIDAKVKAWANGNYSAASKNKNDPDIATYLLRRVGYIETKKANKQDKVYGMCAQILNQCQDYTFDNQSANKNYLLDNDVIRQYLSLALTKIKLKQDTIISEYAETCWNDVYSCLSTNSYDETNTDSTASRTAVNACRGEVATCMSVTGYQPSDNKTLTLAAMSEWVRSKLLSCPANYYLKYAGDGSGSPATMGAVSCEPCPAIGTVQTISSGGTVSMCDCPDGFVSKQDTNGFDFGNGKKYKCIIDTEYAIPHDYSIWFSFKKAFKTSYTNDDCPSACNSGCPHGESAYHASPAKTISWFFNSDEKPFDAKTQVGTATGCILSETLSDWLCKDNDSNYTFYLDHSKPWKEQIGLRAFIAQRTSTENAGVSCMPASLPSD